MMSQTALDAGRMVHAEPALGLPVSWYFDPDILEIEREHLFGAGPTYAGHTSLVRGDGDYVALGGPQLGKLLVRHNGRPQLISNVCRHRQAQMLCGAGHVKNIVCPIHNWAYDLDGRQVAAPHFAESPCLDLERTELTEWNGLLFERGAWSGELGAGRMNSLLPAPCSVPDVSDYVLERVDEEEHDLNWKVFLDVYLEDYHIARFIRGFARSWIRPSCAARFRPWAANGFSVSRYTSAGRFRRRRRPCLPNTRGC